MASAESDESGTSRLWARMEAAFSRLLDAHAAGKAVPLLEADVAAYLYHLLVSNEAGNASRVHLSTRLCGTDGREKYDLAIGDVVETETLKQLFIGLGRSLLGASCLEGARSRKAGTSKRSTPHQRAMKSRT